MDRAVSNYASMKTMRAEFRQTITNPLTGTTSISRGEILRRQPNLMAINFTDPSGDRIVADGKAVWVRMDAPDPWPHGVGCPCGTADALGRVPLASGGHVVHRM